MKLNRRRFLGFTAGAAAGTVVGVPVSQTLSDWVAATEETVYPTRGVEDSVLSICRMCPGGCGLRVRRIDGRPVKLEGNPLHPINGGRLCPRGQAALQSLYHPDRLTQPLRRVGPRGDLDSFQPTSWEEALGEIADRLKLLRQVGRPESLALLRGRSRGIGIRLAQRFLSAFGSPNDISLDRGEEASSLALSYSQGVHSPPSYDLQSTDYVLSFGSALLEASSSPVHMMRAYGEFGRRGKLVQIESRLSLTGSSADEWISVRPGSEGVLALGLAHVLVSEGLYDRDFVSFRTHGVGPYRDGSGNLREGLKSFLEENYYLERVANQTDVPVSVILRLAREFAAARSRLAVGPRRGPLLPGRLFDHLAVQVLNALAGNLDAPIWTRPGGSWYRKTLLLLICLPYRPTPELKRGLPGRGWTESTAPTHSSNPIRRALPRPWREGRPILSRCFLSWRRTRFLLRSPPLFSPRLCKKYRSS
jgi:anaerobic selenocysteine-containing dehydrogenase